MSKLKCLCGNVLSNVGIPNEMEGIIIKDSDLVFNTKLTYMEVMNKGRTVWECKMCGRLAISYPEKNDNEVKWYKPENKEPGNLMKFG